MYWPKDHPPEGTISGTGYLPDDLMRSKNTFLRDTRCCVVIWLCPPQDVQGGIKNTDNFSVYLPEETKSEEESGIDIPLFRVEYATPISWPQDRPPKDSDLDTGQSPDVSVRGKSTLLRDTRCCVAKWLCPPRDVQGATVESIKFRVVHKTLILRPQDGLPDGKVYDNEQTVKPTSAAIRTFCELTGEKCGNFLRPQDLSPDRNSLTKFGVEYGIPLPWPKDRPPDDKSLRNFMKDDRRPGKKCRLDRPNFGMQYGSPLPRPQDRPPYEKRSQSPKSRKRK